MSLIDLKLHEARIQDPIYREGYEASNHFVKNGVKNPYEFPEKLDLERIKISSKQDPLTSQEKVRLKELNDAVESTEWSRWSLGNYYRWKRKDKI
jgi:hypothetical protein